MATMAPNAANDRCPSGYGFSRDGGTRCVGGTHRCGDAAAPTGNAGARPATAEGRPNKPDPKANGVCNNGFDFSRDGGSRCRGGTHRLYPAEGAGNGAGAGNQHGSGVCNNGYVYNRDGGSRCKGGSHRLYPAEGQGNDGAAGQNPNKNQSRNQGAGGPDEACMHGYRYSRDGGSRCFGGSHFRHPPASNEEVKAPEPAPRPAPGCCMHGYGYSRDGGNRCKGGSHYAVEPRTSRFRRQ